MFRKSMTVVGRGNNLIREPVFTHKNIISDNYNTIISTIELSESKGLAEVRRNAYRGQISGECFDEAGRD